MNQNILRVGVGIPCAAGLWQADFGLSLAQMVAHFAQRRASADRPQSLKILHSKGSILPRNRLGLVEGAMKAQLDWLLMVDTDQTFPHDTIHRLLKHNKPVVACNVATKMLPSGPTARRKSATVLEGEPVYTTDATFGLEQVWRIGFGVILFDMRVFAKLGLRNFAMPWVEEIGGYQGEDWSFMTALEAAQIPVYIDHDLSKEVGHIGSYTYTYKDGAQSAWYEADDVND